MTERTLTQVQAPKMEFLRKVHSVTKGRTEVRLCPGQETTLAPPYLNLRYFRSKCSALKRKLGTLLRLYRAPQWFAALGIVSPSLRTWCDTSRQSAQLWNSKSPEYRTASTWENITSSPMDVAPATLLRGKAGMKMNEMNNIYVSLFTGV